MSRYFIAVFLFFSLNAHSSGSVLVIAYGSGDIPVHSSIDVDAEYVAVSISLSSDAKYPSDRIKRIRQLQSEIEAASLKNQNLEFQQGTVSLSPRENSSFSISKSYASNSGSNFYLLAKLGGGVEVYDATEEIYSFVASIKKPDDTEISVGNTSLAISSPDKFREQLLKLVKQEVETTKSVLGPEYKASISGLENPVLVRQKNDKQVTLYVDYSIEFTE